MGSHPESFDASIKKKFVALFEKINEPNYVMDNYYSDNLVNKIVESIKDDHYICNLTTLLVEPIQNLERYHVSVQVFLVRLLAFCFRQELFVAKVMNDINESLRKGYSAIGSPTMIPSLRVAYLDVAISIVEQYTGLYWLLNSGMWKEILSADNESKTVFVTRQKYKFVSRLVWRLNGLEDDANLRLVLTFVLKPLIETEMVISESISYEEEDKTAKQLEPMLHMLNSIMSDYSQLTRSSLVINILLTHFKVVTRMYLFLDRFRKYSMTSLIAKLIFRLILARVFHTKPLSHDTVHTAEDFIETSVAFFNIVNLFISRRDALGVLDYCYSCNEIWNATWQNRMPKINTLDGKKVDLQNKMLFICLVPPITYIRRNIPGTALQMTGNIQDYIMKLINASCEHTAKASRTLSELILELDTETIVLQSVKRLASLNNSMNNEQANLMFQGLFYVLKQFDPLQEGHKAPPPDIMFQEDQENLFVYTYALEAILLLVKNYDINWHESLEVICLYNVVYNILSKQNLSNKITTVTMGSHTKHVETSIKMKFRALFEKITEANYVMDNYYSDNLINKMTDIRRELNCTCRISNQLLEPILHLDRYHVSVQVFLVKLLAFVVREELFCAKIMNKINDTLCQAYHELGTRKVTPSLLVAYLEVALSLVEQHTGLYWLLDSGMWKNILNLNDDTNTVFVKRHKYKFVSRFVWRLNASEDDANVRQVLNFILKPLIETDIVISESITTEEEEEASKRFEPMLLMLQAITSEYRELTTSSLVINALLNHFRLVNHMCVLFDRFRKNSLTSLLSKLLFRLLLAKTLHYKPLTDDTVYNVEDFIEIRASYFNTIQYFTIRRNAMMVLEFCYSCNEFWNGLWQDRKPETRTFDGRKENLQNKALFLCLVPPLTYVTRHLPKTARQEQGCIQDYIMKLINASCEHTAKAATAFGDLILESDTEAIILNSVKRLSSLNNSMNNEQANLMFQGLFYVLKHFDPNPEHFDYVLPGSVTPEEKSRENQENLFVYSYVIEAILLLVKKYHIHWQESLEIVCLYNVVFRILMYPNLSSKFIVTALNVIAVTVRKFLPPNLSLLMESKPGSAMHDLGRLIYMKMHDMHWEVRDSALELLLVCTEISFIKFPPFQKQIIENELIVVATAVALNDHEFYVRASALRCLGAACKVSAIWDQLKNKHPDIQDSLLNVLRHNQEGIVRKEACNVLCELYLNVKLSPDFKQRLYEQMVSAAISDFHWEVQLTALKFWKIVISNSLCEQGMLDGTFPPVTFSKESRKIVTLNKAEIQRRLLKILDELAAKGCLTVLSKLLHEDTEVEIMDANLVIALNLLDILKRYDVPECLKPVEDEPRTMQEYYNDISKDEKMEEEDVFIKTEESESDNVIESIINADDMNLLAHIYERDMKLQNDKPELLPKPMIKLMRYVQPYLFVNHLTSKDFKAVIEYKKQWRNGIRSVESLLDDILGIYEVGQDINNLDCY